MIYNNEYFSDVERVIKNIENIEKIYNKSILITGATGLIGSSLVDILYVLNKTKNAKINILLAARNKSRLEAKFPHMSCKEDYTFVLYDATKDICIKEKADYIIHCAANASPLVYSKEPVETMLANFIGLNNLLNYAKDNSVDRVLYISSSEVYGQKDDNLPYKENDYCHLDILNQRASCPSSKRAAETLCAAYKSEYDLDSVIVRPGHIYGPSITETDSRASAQFTRLAAEGKDIVLKSKGNQLRSYCYSLDCASAIFTVLINGKSVEAYNISNKDSIVTISDLANEMAKAANVKIVYDIPDEVEKKGYNLMSNSSLDSEKLENLNWKAEFSIEEGIEKTISFFDIRKA